jgi:phosphate transport system substrate-binding protein
MSRVASWFVAVVLFVASAHAHAQVDAERVRIHGSQTMAARLVPAVAESWLRDIGYQDIRRQQPSPTLTEIHAQRDGMPLIVEIQANSSAQGFQDLVDGNAHVAMMTRRPDAAELDAGWQLGDLASHDQEFVLALDGAAVVVNRENPLARLSFAQLRRVLSGQVRDWREFGGRGAVHLHMVASANSARDLIDERVMRGAAYAPAAQLHGDGESLVRAIAKDPGGIGFVTLRQPWGAGVRPLALSDGGRAVAPTRLAVQSEDYPLTRRFHLYGSQMMGALSRSFALYAMGQRGQDAVTRAGHFAVTLRPGYAPPTLFGPKDYRDLVASATRLPLSLRFNLTGINESGVAASVYDSRAVRDVERIVAFMQLPVNRGRRLLVVGFADVAGSSVAATMMSNDRADLVAHELMARGVPVLHARGVGAQVPLAASGTPSARYRNERVEIWVL